MRENPNVTFVDVGPAHRGLIDLLREDVVGLPNEVKRADLHINPFDVDSWVSTSGSGLSYLNNAAISFVEKPTSPLAKAVQKANSID
jgi:hypothetical protein